jgi:predicted nucleotidyltransferase
MVLRYRIRLPGAPALARLCRAHHLTGLWLFGSILRDDFRPDSDVDVLVEFEPDAPVGFIELARLQEELCATFGRTVDLVPAAGLKASLRDHVLAARELLYAADRLYLEDIGRPDGLQLENASA